MLPSNSPRRTFAASLAATALVCAPLLYSPFAAAILKYDPVKSTVSATFKQVGVPIEAKFKRIVAHIDYDSAKPDAAHANVEIDVNSFDLGDPEYNKEVMKKEWFNGAQFPKATFVSSSIKAGSNGSSMSAAN
jgi:polyisoprenoid-binding protein YceI